MTDKEIKDWVSLANSTDVNKELASELLMPYAGDLEMLERCFRAWMEQMLVDIINTVRESLMSGDMARASWEVNGFHIVIGRSRHNVWIANGGEITSVTIWTPCRAKLSYGYGRNRIPYKLNKAFCLDDAKPFTDPKKWNTDDYLNMSYHMSNFIRLFKKL